MSHAHARNCGGRLHRGFARPFCVLSAEALPGGLQASQHVKVRLQTAAEQFRPDPSRRGEKSIGIGDRGAGLVYRDGRPASSDALQKREEQQRMAGVWVVKIQPPLDISSDSAGGIGRIPPATLLLSDKTWGFVRFVREEDEGHFSLLRTALSEDHQVAYRYAEELEEGGPLLKVYTALKPSDDQVGW